MDRTTYIDIGGKKYPMRFSMGASIQIGKKFGTFEEMQKNMLDATLDKQIETILWICELLIKQGCAYKNLFEADTPIPDDAPVEDGKYIPPTQEAMEIGLDIRETKNKIFACMGVGSKREVETEDKKKNAKAM